MWNTYFDTSTFRDMHTFVTIIIICVGYWPSCQKKNIWRLQPFELLLFDIHLSWAVWSDFQFLIAGKVLFRKTVNVIKHRSQRLKCQHLSDLFPGVWKSCPYWFWQMSCLIDRCWKLNGWETFSEFVDLDSATACRYLSDVIADLHCSVYIYSSINKVLGTTLEYVGDSEVVCQSVWVFIL